MISTRQTARKSASLKPAAAKPTGRVTKPAPKPALTTRVTRSAAPAAPTPTEPRAPKGAPDDAVAEDFGEMGLTDEDIAGFRARDPNTRKHEGRTVGYKSLRLSARAGSPWALYDPLNAACLVIGTLPPALAPYARFAPGSPRVLEYPTAYRLAGSAGSAGSARTAVPHAPRVRMRPTPRTLRAQGAWVEYTLDGPRLRGV